MKKVLLIVTVLLLSVIALFACSQSGSFGKNNAEYPTVSGELGDFNAVTPTTHFETLSVPSFSWTASTNAETYELEICASEDFAEDDASYFKKTGITTTEYTIGAALKNKNTTYYWRVTAVNSSNRKVFTEGVMDFYYKANVQEQIEMDVIHTDEWTRHKAGSDASLAVDKKDFFGTGKDSLVITFVEEDTNQGEGYEESDGWVVYTHSEDIELYGVDAFYFNFYYAGDDADIFFRVVDEDNEYWKAPIKLANNAKQTIIIHKDEFVLHTKDTTIANQKFDFQYLKSFEIVFEHSFGDGIAYFSDLRVITYEKYEPLFVTTLDFNAYKNGFNCENYEFGTEVSEDGDAFTYTFSGNPNEANTNGIQGYGFVKMPLTTGKDVQDALAVNVNGVILSRGDAFRFKINRTGSNDMKVCVRLIEEDGDRWSYMQLASTVPTGEEGLVVVIPFSAFTMSEFGGDGFRQFYGVKELQFGIVDTYEGGSVTISEFTVVSLNDELEAQEKVAYHSDIDKNGMIEDFEGYSSSVEMYYTWQMSSSNKDEAMAIDEKEGVGVNNTVGMFYYKTNMGEAQYTITIDPIADNPYNAIEFRAKDFSVSEVEMGDGTKESVDIMAKMIVYLVTDTGTMYSFPAQQEGEPPVYIADMQGNNAIADEWRYYKIPFSMFTRCPEYKKGASSVDPDHIVKIVFGVFDRVNQFNSDKDYVTGSAVALDNIRFIVTDTAAFDSLEAKLKPSKENANVTVIDNFDDDLLLWAPKSGQQSYATASLTDEETAGGTGYSLALGYKTRMEANYYSTMFMDDSVKGQGIRFLMKAEQTSGYMPQVSIVIWLKGGDKYQFDLKDGEGTLESIASEWTYYKIGFDKFTKDNAGTQSLNKDKAADITQITLVFKDYRNAPSDKYLTGTVYIDEILIDNTIPLDANARVAYAQ